MYRFADVDAAAAVADADAEVVDAAVRDSVKAAVENDAWSLLHSASA